MFSVASNLDDTLPARLKGMNVDDLFGACDESPLGHGRPRAVTAPVTWRQLERHVSACHRADMGFNLLLNPLCLEAKEYNLRLEKALQKTFKRAIEMGITGVTVSNPWLLSMARQYPFRIRVSVFVGMETVEEAHFWEDLGADMLAVNTHVLCRDLKRLKRLVEGAKAEIELPVNIGCLLRCPQARIHATRISHSSKPGAQPIDPCIEWCRGQRRTDPLNIVRADFVRPEDMHRYEALGIRLFKVVDRSCSTDALVERVTAYHERTWKGNLLELIGPKGTPPRTRRLPVWDSLKHLGLKRTFREYQQAEQTLDSSLPWYLDNQKLEDLLLPHGCNATDCAECGHCARVAARAVRPLDE